MVLKMKKRRFDEGGEVDLPEIPDVGSPYGRYKTATTDTFGEAFAAARDEGKKTFEWNGKQYSTNLASEKKAAKPSPALMSGKEAASDYVREAKRGPVRTSPSSGGADMYNVKRKANEIEGSEPKGSGYTVPKAKKALFAKGGFVRAADGIAQRGKTRGKWC